MRARLVQGELDNAVLIPQVAAIRGNRGEVSVYRIEEGNKYYSVPITLGREYGNAYVVTSGLKAGDLVAIDNIQKLQLFLQPELRSILRSRSSRLTSPEPMTIPLFSMQPQPMQARPAVKRLQSKEAGKADAI